ncbi:MAG: hypothetical protein R2879_15090 [Saprospiraceae bacterium]
MKYLTVALICFALLFACKKSDTPQPFLATNCPFVENPDAMQGAVSTEESEIRTECSNNLLTSKSEITQNLIGEWKLVGYGAGWVPSTSMPCSEFTFTASNLVVNFHNSWVDTTINYTWSVEEDQNTGHFYLDTEPSLITGFQINNFCKEFMYFDYKPLDGDLQIYQKQ